MKFPPDLLRACWFLAGPTASGKSAAALLLAQQLNAEIISLDSMAIFRGMDIGTAKSSVSEQQLVRHHLLDVVDPSQEFSTAQFLQAALAACEDIRDRGKTPLFVGGTGLYLRSVLRGVFEGPAADWTFRNNLESGAARNPSGWLHAQLQQVDPVTAARLHPNDERRLVRALEIHHLTGIPASRQQDEMPLPVEQRPQHVYWLSPPRDWLAERINTRVLCMFAAGLVGEVDRLRRADPPLGKTARQALAYREILEWLDAGASATSSPPPQLIETIQTRTRQFAKRQLTWFRNLEECRPLEITGSQSAKDVCQQILEEAARYTA